MPGPLEMGMQPGPLGTSPMQGMSALQSLQQTPQPDREIEALKEATNIVGVAMSGVQMRSPRAARFLADAASKIQQAIQTMNEEGMAMLPPPNMGSGVPPMGMAPGPGGM